MRLLPKRNSGFACLLAGAALAMLPSQANAAWQQDATVRLTTEYESNPLMTTANAGDVRRTLLEPGYTLTGRFDADEYRAGLSLMIMRTSNQILNPDRENPATYLEWLRQLDGGEVGANVRYSEVSTREAVADTTAQVYPSSIRASRSAGAKWKKSLSPRTGFTTEISQENVFYNGGNFINYSSRSASLVVHHDWDERSSPYARLLYSDYIPADTLEYSRLQSAALGTNLAASEQLTGSAEVGRAATSNADMITYGSMALQYTQLQAVWNISAERHVTASGLGGYVQADQATGNWRYALSERNSMGLDVIWQHSQPVSSSATIAAQGTRRTAGIWLQNDLDQNWQIRTYLMHNILETDSAGPAYSNLAGITLTYTRPDF